MSISFQVLWLLISIVFALAYPNQKKVLQQPALQPTFRIENDPKKPLWHNVTSQQVFSLKTNRIRTQWHDSPSLLQRRAPDAVSIHVDPHHLFAWTPLKLGGQSNPHLRRNIADKSHGNSAAAGPNAGHRINPIVTTPHHICSGTMN